MNLSSRAAVGVLALGLSVGVSACGGEPAAAPPSSAATDVEVCTDVDALRADLDDLKAIEVQPGSLADFDEVEADVGRLVEDAASEYENEVDAVQSATKALAASVESATRAPSGPAVTQVSADFGAFTAAVSNLQEAVGGTC